MKFNIKSSARDQILETANTAAIVDDLAFLGDFANRMGFYIFFVWCWDFLPGESI